MQKGQFQLLGTLLSDQVETAILREIQGGRVLRVKQGETVHGMVLERVEADRIVLAQYGDSETVLLKIQPSPKGQPAPVAPVPTPAASAPVPAPAAPQPAAPAAVPVAPSPAPAAPSPAFNTRGTPVTPQSREEIEMSNPFIRALRERLGIGAPR